LLRHRGVALRTETFVIRTDFDTDFAHSVVAKAIADRWEHDSGKPGWEANRHGAKSARQ
jgi:hypothetical protein